MERVSVVATEDRVRVEEAIRAAGEAVRRLAADGFEVARKANADPVTTADLAADGILREALLGGRPDDGWLSEETRDDPARLERRRVWVVDPIDGTKEFVTGLPEYAVSVALVIDGQVALGAVYNPATDELFTAAAGAGAWLDGEPLAVRPTAAEPLTVLASRSEIARGEFARFHPLATVVPSGSIAYKLALVAAGRADTTFSLGPKNEWDIAAGVLLVAEAGGRVEQPDRTGFRFNRPNTLVGGIVASSAAAHENVRRMIAAPSLRPDS